MSEDVFSKELILEAKKGLEDKMVKNVIFSSSTYQVEIEDKGAISWTFIQFDENFDYSDLFCECGGSKTSPCVHLAASALAIYRDHIKPIHVRYIASLWKALFSQSCKNFGYDQKDLKREGDCYYLEKEGKRIFSLTCKTQRAKENCKILIDEKIEETEETSIKFSNLSACALDDYRNGNPSEELKFELSSYSDFAKLFLFFEDEDGRPPVALSTKEEIPANFTTETKDFSLKLDLKRNVLEEIILPLKDYAINIAIFDVSGREIDKVVYNEEDATFSIKGVYRDESAAMDGVEIGEWIYRKGKGFYPRQNDPLLSGDIIQSELIEEALDKYSEKFASLMDMEILFEETPLQFDLYFDTNKNLHITTYLFKQKDLSKKNAQMFGRWAYIPKKGFFLVKGQVFTGIERVIKREDLTDFIDQEKQFLSKFEGFSVHLTSIESTMRYSFNRETLSILGDELLDQEGGVVDCGKYLFVSGQGFFVQGGSKHDKHVFPGMKIKKEELSNFITVNKEELETVIKFFCYDDGIEKTGLEVTYNEASGITIEPRYYFSKELIKYEPTVYGDYIYLSEKGFLEIPLSMRLPAQYLDKTVIEISQIPFFLKHELSKIQPYVIYLDTRLVIPEKLTLRVNYIEKISGIWKMQFVFKSALGEVNASDIYNNYIHFSAFLLSPAGMLMMKDDKFSWLQKIPRDKIDLERNLIELSTLDWIKITVTDDVYLPHSSEDPIQAKYIEMLKSLHLDQMSEMPKLKGLKSILRPYQEIGVKWLWFLYSFGLPGGFLCDDMGLGKTHQSMALLAALMNHRKKSEREKCLVVCPTSVIYHWEDLLEKFLEKGKVLFYHGSLRNPKELKKKGYDIILTTYGIVRSDKELFCSMDFEIAIFDEIQVAKNQKSQIHKTLKMLKTKMNLALTGTPIENSLSELKSLFDIILPKYLPVESEFKEKFVIPIERDRNIEANKILAALIKPFVLRRKKGEVLDDLPEKTEEISISDLLPKQRELYVKIATRSKEEVDEEDKHFHMHVFALLNKLKQVCNHPALYYKDLENYKEYKSGKWDLFVELLEESRRSKQKVVVFTQYLGMMDIMEKYLIENEIQYSSIRGSTSNRREQVSRFQNDPDCEVFVGSLNAAGVGIDLTAGSVVIHYDRWWNPARENQATDRVHRMGQSKGVSVFKFVTKNSIEEHINNIIERKSKLIENIVGYDSEGEFKKLGKTELKLILRKIQEDL